MRSLLAVLALVVAVSACGGAGVDPQADAGEENGACGPVEQPEVQPGLHLTAGQDPPVPYSSIPPTSGWHVAYTPEVGVYGDDDAMPDIEQVAMLELGAVVITHGELAVADRAALEELVAEEALDGRTVLTPHPELGEGQVAVATWGALRSCDGIDTVALRDFARTFAVIQGSPH